MSEPEQTSLAVGRGASVAKASAFGERTAHGMLSAELSSAVLDARLPGPGSIYLAHYLAQTLRFRAPVRIGDTATATATAEVLSFDPASRKATLRTTCTVAGKLVIDGEAAVLAPARP